MDPFIEIIVSLITQALHDQGVDSVPEIPAGKIERPPNPELGDYAFPCFLLSKAMRKAPAQIATELEQAVGPAVSAAPQFAGVRAAGPYLNFTVSVEGMARLVIPAILDGSYFQSNRQHLGKSAGGKKVMVEYSQPNTHKAFHVGHMRNVAVGDALTRILEYNGNEVVAANYIGDSGAHIAKCLWYYDRHREGEPPAPGEPPFAGQTRGEWLGRLYTAATEKLAAASAEERQRYDSEIGTVLQQLESKTGAINDLWLRTRQWSLDAFDEIYRWLGARFDHVFYESDMEMGRRIVDEGLESGVFHRSQGAVGIDFGEDDLGFFMVLKADGTTLYSTKDLALAKIKFQQFGIEESIYVVGAEQKLHFQQVFRTLGELGYTQAERCKHVAYGLVVLPAGKMSSRAGNAILFSSLRQALNDYIFENYLDARRGEWDEAELAETARRIAVAGIRYGMVKQDPARQITFNLDDWLVSEGNTGTYLCYAYTRIMSVGRIVPDDPDPEADFSTLRHEYEKALLRELHEFNRHVRNAGERLEPNLVANALYGLAQAFSSTYHVSPVKRAENADLRAARLALFHATGRVMRHGLELLGIEPPERM